LVAFSPDRKGLAINSVVSNLRSLETTIVKQCLVSLREQLKDRNVSRSTFAYSIKALDTYGPGKCHVEFVGTIKKEKLVSVNHSHMSLDDVEKKLFLATSHLSDLRVGPDAAAKSTGSPDLKVASKYPRAFPIADKQLGKLYVAGKAYHVEVKTVGDLSTSSILLYDKEVPRPDLYNYKECPIKPPVPPPPFEFYEEHMDETPPVPKTPTYEPASSPTYAPATPEPVPVAKPVEVVFKAKTMSDREPPRAKNPVSKRKAVAATAPAGSPARS
jgi:hypothetical protein